MRRSAFRPAAVAAILLSGAAWCADPQDYTLVNPVSGDGAVDAALRQQSLLISLRNKTPAPPFALIDRARGDAERFQSVLESFGYYQAKVAITIAGRPLADKALPDVLEAVPQGQSVEVKTEVVRGPQYSLRRIDVSGDLPAGFDAGAVMGISSGDPAEADRVLAAQNSLTAALQEQGYAFAKVSTPDAFADDTAHAIDVTFAVTTGARATIGAISFSGLKNVNEIYARDNLKVAVGDLYRPSKIEAARLDLVNLGVFSGVSVEPPSQADAKGAVPLTFDVQERLQHAVALSGTYSTDLGVSLSARWSHRNLLGNGEQLNLSASGIGLGGTATAGIGYNLMAQFIKPRFLRDDQELEVNVGAIKQHLDAYAQTAESFGIFARKRFSKLWSGTSGLSFIHDEVSQEGSDRTYELLALPVTAVYDSTDLTDPLSDPTEGGRGTLSVAPTFAFGAKSLTFAVLQASGSLYFDLFGDGRSVLATRALLGSVQGGNNFDLPPDQRLYAGGSGTVRGFRYQSIGPHYPSDHPAGASSIDAFSVELRQRVYAEYGFAAFVDAGQASADNLPFNGAMQVGAGAGLRYYTPIGAVRFDVAVPVTRVPKGDAFELYISIGQAF